MNSKIDIVRRGTRIYTIVPDADTACIHEVGHSRSLNIKWRSGNAMSIACGDSITIGQDTFYFFSKPSEEMVSTMEWKYSATLYGEEEIMSNTMCLFLDQINELTIQSQCEYSLITTPAQFLSLIVRNINRNVTNPWSYKVERLTKEAEQIQLSINSDKCDEVLEKVAKEAEAEWMFDASTRTLILSDKDAIELNKGMKLTYPENLLSPFTVEHDEMTVSRLFVAGGQRNITSDYANGESDRLLMRDGLKFLERDSAIPREEMYIDDSIYPRLNSTIKGVRRSQRGFFFVSDVLIDFNINQQLAEGKTAKIAFKSGRLAGYEFEIASFDNSSKTMEIRQQTESDVVIPNDTMQPQVGDEYVLLDIIMPSSYVVRAEEELYEKALAKFDSEYGDKIKASVDVSTIWLIRHNIDIKPFDKVVINVEGGERQIRVAKVQKYPFDGGTYGRKMDVELSDYTFRGAITEIRRNISETNSKMNNSFTMLSHRQDTISRNADDALFQLNWNQGMEDGR